MLVGVCDGGDVTTDWGRVHCLEGGERVRDGHTFTHTCVSLDF